MKTLSLLLAFLGLRAFAMAADNVDHLVPLDRTWSPKYRAILADKLMLTGFDCGRVVIRPPFEKPEESVSVYSRLSPSGGDYALTYLVAEENLWDATSGGEFPAKANGIGVRRVDAEISRDVAELIRQVWLGILQNMRGRFPPPPGEREVIPGDPTQIEFSLERSDGPPREGQLNVFLETQREKVKSLMELSDDLIAYCQAQPDRRPLIAKKIKERATNLILRLKKEKLG